MTSPPDFPDPSVGVILTSTKTMMMVESAIYTKWLEPFDCFKGFLQSFLGLAAQFDSHPGYFWMLTRIGHNPGANWADFQ